MYKLSNKEIFSIRSFEIEILHGKISTGQMLNQLSIVLKQAIEIDSKNCLDERGCKEIYKNDTLNINGDNEYKANVYQTHAPRYIPY